MFGMGCFWGAERKFWELGDGIHITAVGYAAGHTPNPTYQEVCSGRTGHNEVVLVVYDPKKISYERLLKTFWENHDPTQGMRQGNDVGTQYRSGIYVFTPEQRQAAEASKAMYDEALKAQALRCDHHGDPRCAAVLFRRGLSPAVPGEEPDGLLRPRRHRRELPDRDRRRRALSGVCGSAASYPLLLRGGSSVSHEPGESSGPPRRSGFVNHNELLIRRARFFPGVGIA